MGQNIEVHIADLVASARSEINEISPEEIIKLQEENAIQLIDVRDVRERDRSGFIEGALHVPRGMLEFWIDPDSPYHKSYFAQDNHFVFYCASGWRSALSTKTAQDMGLAPVSHIKGGFAAWVDAGGEVAVKK